MPDTESESDEGSTLSEIVVITGMSGAGRSEAIHTFEDIGYFCIDNLPPSFIPQLVDLTALPGSRIRRMAVVCDLRGREFFDELAAELKRLKSSSTVSRILYLEADEETLVRRFNETRRRHPLCEEGASIIEGIRAERDALTTVRGMSDIIIDTSDMKPRKLRTTIKERFFRESPTNSLAVTVSSFGFKYGVPIDADVVMDVRFLPNPYYNPDLRDLTGLDEPVREFVLGREETVEFLARWTELLRTLMPGYLMEGKSHLSISLGCTGGMHRSVALAEETALFLTEIGYVVAVSHRDIGKDREHG